MFTTAAFDRRLAAFERAEAGRTGRPLGDNRMGAVAFARRLAASATDHGRDPALMSQGPALLLRS